MRVFLDTNVVVSAFATRGLAADVLRVVMAEHDLVIGERVLAELRRVLTRKLKIPETVARELEDFLRRQGEVISAEAKPAIKVRDAADARILGEALAARADVLVTGDKDLLDVAGNVPLPILTPRGFWTLLRGKQERG